jgi:hypothetical protein
MNGNNRSWSGELLLYLDHAGVVVELSDSKT